MEKQKKGGAGIIILAVMIIILIIGIGVYLYLNNSSRIIKKEFYKEFSYEACELNFDSQLFSSKEDCYNANKCMSEIFLELVSEEDRKDVAKRMKQKGGEDGFIYYAQQNPSIYEDLENRRSECY